MMLLGCSPNEAPRAEDQVDLQGLELTRLDGTSVPLQHWKGRVLIINLWATWCAPCREEMPALQALSEQLDPERYKVAGISVDRDLNLVKEFLLKYGIDFAEFRDPNMKMAKARLGVEVLPETLIIDSDGRLHRRVTGIRDWSDADFLESILPGGLAGG
ncbi:TlpA disulfide reductase family protein [Motiliproteus sp. SC1-56]|uniref:TlpA family protein disulfide reductase n=1 Tax=Motiliproteus sp. SC1-56 TaxID=2799565 RepID=UPI001A8C8310|nr:TlpA disulfide reductase family protein [Motiliproteus sp. SC1-56]